MHASTNKLQTIHWLIRGLYFTWDATWMSVGSWATCHRGRPRWETSSSYLTMAYA